VAADSTDQDVPDGNSTETLDGVPEDRLSISSVLLIQFRFLGDLVLGISLLDNLKRHYPNARLSILSDAGNAPLFALRPDIEFIPHYRRRKGSRSPLRAFGGWASSVRELRSRRFDVLIDCSNSRSGAILSTISGAKVRIGYRPYKRVPSRAFTRFATEWGRGTHYVDRFLSPLEALELPVLTREPRLRASNATRDRITQRLSQHGLGRNGYVAVHTGARVPGRQWPVENFARVIDDISTRYGLRSVLVGGPGERDVTKAICGLSQSRPLDLTGQVSLEELVATFEGCRFFLGNDSGPMHIAAAAGAPVVALFGLQWPEQWGPLGEGHVIVRPSMPCPCPFPDICRPPDPQATFCVRRLTVDDVVEGVTMMMRVPVLP